jgi:hypothetical protein
MKTMDYTFSEGDEVRFLTETGSGIIRKIKADGTVMVETEDGFEMPYAISQLVPRFDLQKKEEKVEEVPKVKEPLTSYKGFKLGMKVSMPHEDLDGQVMGFDEDKGLIQVEWEDLILQWYRPQELVAMEHEQMQSVMQSLDKVSLQDIGEKPARLSSEGVMKDRKDHGVWEVDLHIQELVDNSYGMMNHQIVQAQLDHFDKKLNEAIDKGLKKVIFIHGRGEGKLRVALRQILERYPNCECLDADYQRYGVGATEVRIKHRRVEDE